MYTDKILNILFMSIIKTLYDIIIYYLQIKWRLHVYMSVCMCVIPSSKIITIIHLKTLRSVVLICGKVYITYLKYYRKNSIYIYIYEWYYYKIWCCSKLFNNLYYTRGVIMCAWVYVCGVKYLAVPWYIEFSVHASNNKQHSRNTNFSKLVNGYYLNNMLQ